MVWALFPVGALTIALGTLLLWQHRRLRTLARTHAGTLAAQTARLAALERLTVRNSAILENAMDGFFVLGQDYRFVEVNAAFSRMTGYTTAELLGLKMTDLEVSAAVQSDSPYTRTGLHHFATAHRHKDGHIIQLESCVIVLRDGAQKILVGFARDVTERCRAEQALRESEQQYRNLVETSRDLIWSLDLAGRWTFVNNAARTIYGYDPEEMLGRPLMDFVVPELCERTHGVLEELRSGKSRVRCETIHLRQDGGRVDLSMNVMPVLDDYGNVIGFTGTAADVSERKQAETRLREANARFESLVQGMPLGYIVWSQDGRIVEWNPAASAIFGYTAEEAVGRLATELIVPPESHKAFLQMCQALLAPTGCPGGALVNRKKGGEKIRCEWYNTVLPDPVGGVQGVATLVRDVSERERLEAQLRQSQKLESLGVLAGGVAHDFNNLLVGVLGNASLAIEKLPANSSVRPLLERVVNAGRRATELTQRMLAYAGRASCDIKLMDMNLLVEELAEFAKAAIPKSVQLTIRTTPDLPLIEADSGQVQQVIMNLLMNAAEAIGDETGEVTVATWTEELDVARIAADFADRQMAPGPYVGLEVRDTGCGMPPEVLSRMFDPFFTTKFAGRGLGLSAILGIVRAHHGTITYSSQVGVGTVFRVLFPAVKSAARPQPVSSESAALPRGSTVLVIDDEEDIREVVQAVLESRGINVLTAEDGPRGLQVFRQSQATIDVVLLDINMPGMNGETVFRELCAIRPDVRVVLSTGYSEQETALHFADASLAGFVHKPYTASGLVDKIGAALLG
jgi:PAS domain S-box-containing protein